MVGEDNAMKYLIITALILMAAIGGFLAGTIYVFWKFAPLQQEKTIKYERRQKELQEELYNICVKNLEKERGKVERHFNNSSGK